MEGERRVAGARGGNRSRDLSPGSWEEDDEEEEEEEEEEESEEEARGESFNDNMGGRGGGPHGMARATLSLRAVTYISGEGMMLTSSNLNSQTIM